ncbi:hypothetical protein Tco_1436676, partial [Tanacetum coccineum]
MDQQERGRGEVKDVAVPSVAGAVASQEPVIPPMPAVHHPWLLFPPALPVRVLMLYITRLIEYLPKEIEAAHYLDWDMLSTMQVDRSFNHFLTQRYHAPDGTVLFTCRAWRRLFQGVSARVC